MMERLFRTEVKPFSGAVEGILLGSTGHSPDISSLEDGWYALDVITDIYSYESFVRFIEFRKSKGIKINICYDVFNNQEPLL